MHGAALLSPVARARRVPRPFVFARRTRRRHGVALVDVRPAQADLVAARSPRGLVRMLIVRARAWKLASRSVVRDLAATRIGRERDRAQPAPRRALRPARRRSAAGRAPRAGNASTGAIHPDPL